MPRQSPVRLGHKTLGHRNDDDATRDVDVFNDRLDKRNLKRSAIALDLQTILGGTGNDVGDAAKRDPAGIDNVQPDELVRPVFVTIKITSLRPLDQERSPPQQLGSIAVIHSPKADQKAVFVGLHSLDREDRPVLSIRLENAANRKAAQVIGQRSHHHRTLDAMGAPNVANLD